MLPQNTRSRPELTVGLLHQLAIDAANAHSFADQIERLVRQVQRALDVEVCSLYQVTGNESLALIANVGLAANATRKIDLNYDEGLVGVIASTKLPLSVKQAPLHPAYKFFS